MAVKIISEKDFKELIAQRGSKLLSLANKISKCKSTEEILTRSLLGELLSQSTQVEELLDAYGASHNCDWCEFRALTAAIKGFSDVSYELLHIRAVLPGYPHHIMQRVNRRPSPDLDSDLPATFAGRLRQLHTQHATFVFCAGLPGLHFPR